MPPKASSTPSKRKCSEAVGSRKRSKPTIPDTDDEDIDELADRSDRKDKPNQTRASPRTRTTNKKSSPQVKSAPKAKRRGDPNSVYRLKLARAEKNKELKILKEQKEASENNERRLKEEALRSQNHINVLRERELASKQQGGQYMQDDEFVQQSLNDLSKKISDFSASWARKETITQRTDPAQATQTIKVLQGFHGLSHNVLRRHLGEKLIWQPGGSRLAVQTILEHIIVERYLTRPFNFLASSVQKGAVLSESSLLMLQSRMRGSESPDKTLWPARTLRSLYASYQVQTSSVEPIPDDEFDAERNTEREELLRLCLDGSQPLLPSLLKVSDAENSAIQRAGLARIFQIAAKVSLQTWIQGIVPTVHWQGSAVFNKGFIHNHTHFDPHLLMQPNIDDELLVNRDIDWIIRPCITFRRHHADGSQSMDIIGLKAQVMLLNFEKCLIEKARKPEPKRSRESAEADPMVSNVTPIETSGDLSIGGQATEHEPLQVQSEEHDSDTIIVQTSETEETTDSESEGQEATVKEDNETMGIHVDHEVTDHTSASRRRPFTRNDDLRLAPLDRRTRIIDLTGDGPRGLARNVSGCLDSTRERRGDSQPAPLVTQTDLSQPSPGRADFSVPVLQEEKKQRVVEDLEVQRNERTVRLDTRESPPSAQNPFLDNAVHGRIRGLQQEVQLEEALDAKRDLATKYGFPETDPRSRSLDKQDHWRAHRNTTEDSRASSYVQRLASQRRPSQIKFTASLRLETGFSEQSQLPIEMMKPAQDEARNSPNEHAEDRCTEWGDDEYPIDENLHGEWFSSLSSGGLSVTGRRIDEPACTGLDEHEQPESPKIISPYFSKDRRKEPNLSEDETATSQRDEATLTDLHVDNMPTIPDRLENSHRLSTSQDATENTTITPDETADEFLTPRRASIESSPSRTTFPHDVVDLCSSDASDVENGDSR